MSGLTVRQAGADRLILQRSRLRELLAFGLAVGLVFLWYSLLANGRILDLGVPDRDWMWWLAMLAPLTFLPRVYRAFRVLIFGERWDFSQRDRVVRRNGSVLMRLHEIRAVEMQRTPGTDHRTEDGHPDLFRLVICKKDGGQVVVDHGDNSQLVTISRSIANLVGVDVFYSGR